MNSLRWIALLPVAIPAAFVIQYVVAVGNKFTIRVTTGIHPPPRQNSCRFTDSNALLRRFAKVGQDKDIFSALGHLGKRSLVPIQLTAEFVEIRTVRIDSPIKLNERYSLVPPSEVVTCMLK